MAQAVASPAGPGPAAPGAVLLSLKDVHAAYGRIEALQGISIEVRRGEIVAMLGGNGAGKSTTLKTISGLMHPRSGRIEFEGKDVSAVPAYRLVKLGIGQAPEGRRIFGRMTTLENLQMGAYSRHDRGEIEADYDRVFGLFPRLLERRGQSAGTLSGGEQQMLAIARALMGRPKLLLLDEPSMGLAPNLVEQIFEIITDINSQGTTILLVEQNALMALHVASRGYILQTGKIVLADTSANLAANEEVKKAYLGA
ncbi:MAG TPA: ABC transporter ATP-binding protein [Candidatus Limnocylindrales bacterium]|jgi:branched-chain amino acid transport system ATP-binding protein